MADESGSNTRGPGNVITLVVVLGMLAGIWQGLTQQQVHLGDMIHVQLEHMHLEVVELRADVQRHEDSDAYHAEATQLEAHEQKIDFLQQEVLRLDRTNKEQQDWIFEHHTGSLNRKDIQIWSASESDR